MFHYFRLWQRAAVWRAVHDTVRGRVRRQEGRRAGPTAGVLDSQTVKGPGPADARGYDGGKTLVGRKRHLLVDTTGLVLAVMVTAASLSDVAGAKLVLHRAAKAGVRLRAVWADFAYRGLAHWAGWPFRAAVDVVTRAAGRRGFVPWPAGGWWSGRSPGSGSTGGCGPTTGAPARAARRSSTWR